MRDRPSKEFMRRQRSIDLQSRRHWVYGLILEDCIVFYVGCSSDPWTRIHQHRWRLGVPCQLIIFGAFLSRREALEAERKVIGLFPNPFNGRRRAA